MTLLEKLYPSDFMVHILQIMFLYSIYEYAITKWETTQDAFFCNRGRDKVGQMNYRSPVQCWILTSNWIQVTDAFAGKFQLRECITYPCTIVKPGIKRHPWGVSIPEAQRSIAAANIFFTRTCIIHLYRYNI